MSLSFFSDKDLKAIAAKGISVQQVLRQLETFRRGTKALRIAKPARVGDGIVQIPPDEREAFISLHDRAAESGRMLKFVPASGVASRMFKDWYRWY
ncbi:MAG: DUF4301 family protein, partial [Thermodesulfobacteriota bacterium]